MPAFELVRGYTPVLGGLPQTPVSEDIKKAYRAQTVRLEIQRILKDKQESILPTHLLSRDREVYYFVKAPKFVTWKQGYVCQVHPHVIDVSSSKDHKGQQNRVAYEDISLGPDNSLLQE